MYSQYGVVCSARMIPAHQQGMEARSEPWRAYYDEFAERAARIPDDAFDREQLLYDAAHRAYQCGTNRLTAEGWEAERALVIGRMFGSVVKDWVQQGGRVVESLESELQSHYRHWTD